MYNDDSLLIRGKFKLRRLRTIPSFYLLKIHANGGSQDKELAEYIKTNIDRIKSADWDNNQPSIESIICSKIYFCNEKTAKDYLNSRKGDNKPVRCYECPKCGAWHLTSIPFDEWRKIKSKQLTA